jgi:biotin carboxyl carrier protein
MKLEIRVRGRTRTVEFAHPGPKASGSGGGRWACRVDGRPVEVDVVELAPGVFSLLLDGHAFEVRVEAAEAGLRVQTAGEDFVVELHDPRLRGAGGGRGGSRRGGLEAEGRQEVSAPMPCKVVRVLVKLGEQVEAGQGLLVVEAMKMQNEIRATRTGKIEKLAVAEGQAVNAGEVLAIVA